MFQDQASVAVMPLDVWNLRIFKRMPSEYVFSSFSNVLVILLNVEVTLKDTVLIY